LFVAGIKRTRRKHHNEIVAALSIDLFVKSADELLDEIGRHQSLAAIEDESLQDSAADALPIGAGPTPSGGRAGEVIAADGGVAAATFLAADEAAQKVARSPALPESGRPRIGHAFARANGALACLDHLPQLVVDDAKGRDLLNDPLLR
jgi:hypothetical protein